MLVGVNITDYWLCAAASVLRCKVEKVSFLYPGLPIDGDPRRLGFWELVLNRIQNRLSGWKSQLLSFGGRLILLKYVPTSLSVYALSFFKAPSGKPLGSVETLFVWGRSGSSWWREIVRIRDEVDGLGGEWFGEGVLKKMGDGTKTFFWTDPWLGGTPLCVRFGRLFDLVVNKSSTVAEMWSLGWVTRGEAWEWRRRLWAWEEMLGECQSLLHDFTLQAQSSDTWTWRLDSVSGYSVRGAYQLLTSHPSNPLDVASDLICHKQVPLKVSIFAWRLLRDRLPTESNLAICGIITPEAKSCVAGCGDMETA
ncbi:hypothetical protein TSUD_112390 [Trifolium subterraneum]|uniref:Reverse transcriptase zinc-binding domain-containing protein n=1 Tax=Trifolium subterraneum TaxID=3900 RepID=A0A2Z6LFU0_TRISU|nr:hypothetical protein TSUD_112390 [Trifolium subterraneum]